MKFGQKIRIERAVEKFIEEFDLTSDSTRAKVNEVKKCLRFFSNRISLLALRFIYIFEKQVNIFCC